MSVRNPLPHDAAALHVTGAARYVDDVPMPAGTLHLAFGTSEIAHGTLADLDLSAVWSADGVVAVLTADDMPFENDVSPSVHDEPMLCTGEIMYYGMPLFLVVATSHHAARHAAAKAKASFDALPAILTIDDALAVDSRFEDVPRIYEKGALEDGFAAASHRISGSFEMGGQEHFYLEGQAALAMPQENGDMVIQSSTQHPTEIQHKVAHAIGVPMHGVRVEIRRMGGGFGGKESQGNALAVACAVAARHTGAPCKMRYDRDDDMMITGKRHEFRVAYDIGFDDDGRLHAVDFTHWARCGWAQDLSLPVADRAMLHADNAYLLDHLRITSHRMKTHTQSATAFRGFGGPQGMLGIERVMDHVAHALGMDAAQVRRVNYYAAAGENDAQTTPYHMPVTDFELHAMTDELLAQSDYTARRAAIADWNAGSPILKRGIAFCPVKFGISFTLTHLNQAGALVHVYQDGSIQLNHGGTEMGQGLFQKVAQVAASRFGVDMDHIRIMATDTGKVPNTSATAASSGTDLNGMAVQAACDTIRERLAVFHAERAGVTANDVQFNDNQVIAGDHSMTFAEAVMLAYQARVSLSSTGFYATPDVEWDRIAGRGRPFFYFAYGAAISEVVVDTLTGENRILRTDILHDAGASLNPALDIGQVEGGFVQGAGWLTTEELVWDDTGRLRTHAPSTYKIPACGDRPDVFNVDLWDGRNREDTIYRSKAVGEPPFMLGNAVFFALSDAVAASGATYPDLQAPATAEAVLAAVGRAQS
ncbi:xanthine dehydrogenase molybdopterin binding subunit [Thalassobium sp. R2A62]|uniref:xanthine dehydrogenase molybdopterin binding subunit n=1 Tax=Thalassobium sp. R2A62 TaxID=633131 RepID=UPI0001B1D714|nr:xanthine dehydrogenase molybdopterin binding subunit [Thalassobium sp. R2A62]EET49327.1 xanthine dehydrogenase, molybdopterin binding subunit [Thalassobium sp. R2A62]